jgi:hypothetical protein
LPENKEASEIDDVDEKAVGEDSLGSKTNEDTDGVDSSLSEKEVELSTEENNDPEKGN